jgi:hypothetical protein
MTKNHVAVFLGAVLLFGAWGYAAVEEVKARPCCYTNPQYTGACTVQPAKGETCASILAFLNDPRSLGKSYCDNTSIRGGWVRTKCATRKAASPSPTPH